MTTQATKTKTATKATRTSRAKTATKAPKAKKVEEVRGGALLAPRLEEKTQKIKTPKELKEPVRWTLERAQALGGWWNNVVAISEHSTRTGRPKRVVIACTREGCGKTREIATQDGFQTHFCSAACRKGAKTQ